MSTFKVEVVPVTLEPHPNADSLSIVRPFGYQVVVRTEDWQHAKTGAYVPPDSVVPEGEEPFAFLGTHTRITTRKFRGMWSQGLLVPTPAGFGVGDDVAEHYGITHYEPPLRLGGYAGAHTEGDAEPAPDGYYPKYDVEHMRRYGAFFVPGEPVMVTEKLHGTNARFLARDGRFWCGSRNQWKKESEGSVYWRALKQHAGLRALLEDFAGFYAVYGEIYGWVQDLRYGHLPGVVSFGAFDVWVEHHPISGPHWLAADAARNLLDEYEVPQVPLLYRGPFDLAQLEALAEGPSMIPGANHTREGIVVKPLTERNHPEIGRIQLKLISNAYLEKAA